MVTEKDCIFCKIARGEIGSEKILDDENFFAIKDIPKGINPFNKAKAQGWQKFKISELRFLDKEVFKMVEAFFTIQKDNTIYIPKGGLNEMNISYIMNDSFKPNVKMAKDEVNFITLRKINKGEELTVSYETYLEK